MGYGDVLVDGTMGFLDVGGKVLAAMALVVLAIFEGSCIRAIRECIAGDMVLGRGAEVIFVATLDIAIAIGRLVIMLQTEAEITFATVFDRLPIAQGTILT